MSHVERNAIKALYRLKCKDPTLNWIVICDGRYTDDQINELCDELIKTPNIAMFLSVRANKLTDEIGIKLARYLAVSTTICQLGMHHNRFSDITFRAIAAALRFNTSLKHLHLHYNNPTDFIQIEAEFVDALILNPNRPIDSAWLLFNYRNDFDQLKTKADQLGHPNMQSLLAMKLF